jgi:nicotinamide-nucleotide amidase
VEVPEGAAVELVALLLQRHRTVAVAESLTGGLLASALVDVPGASAVFRGGLVVYATDLKATLAGVPADLLTERGPVDAEVALELARGAAMTCRADHGLATTGVAGPDPQDGKPVGLVYVAGYGPAGRQVRELRLTGGRPAIRHGAVTGALTLLTELLQSELPIRPAPPGRAARPGRRNA